MKTIYLLILLFICSSCSAIKNNTISKKIVAIRTTAYHAKESDHIKYGCKNAIGTVLKIGQIATDWSVFPVGTKLRIDHKTYEVSDYGSALVKPKNAVPTVDIYTSNRVAMNKWGVRHFNDAEVIQWGSYEKSRELLSDRLKYKHCRIMYDRISEKL
jgi:3D (Asp-Asp-Asp) domain-containing protein